MRVFIPVCMLVATIPLPLVAQGVGTASREIGFDAGLSRTGSAEGLTARITLAPFGVERLLSLRVEAGARITPTHWFWSTGRVDSETTPNRARSRDLSAGLTGVVSPFARKSFAPYVVGGALVVQDWFSTDATTFGDVTGIEQPGGLGFAWTSTSVNLVGGLGVRATMFGHRFQLEVRRYNYTTSFTLGSGIGL